MCKIVKMSYDRGSLIVEVSSTRELVNCIFELCYYDFLKCEYVSRLKQVISSQHIAQDNGLYRFRCEVPSNQKIKCIISDGNEICAARERFVGELNNKIKIKVSAQSSEIGTLYTVRSDISVSGKLIYYKSPVSETKIYLPGDIIAGQPLIFKIKSGGFSPVLTCDPDFSDCFSIEG